MNDSKIEKGKYISKNQIKEILLNDDYSLMFKYNGKRNVVFTDETKNQKTFKSYNGSNVRNYDSIDDLLCDAVFDGNSIVDLIGEVTFIIS